jgi:hypothetical protein
MYISAFDDRQRENFSSAVFGINATLGVLKRSVSLVAGCPARLWFVKTALPFLEYLRYPQDKTQAV